MPRYNLLAAMRQRALQPRAWIKADMELRMRELAWPWERPQTHAFRWRLEGPTTAVADEAARESRIEGPLPRWNRRLHVRSRTRKNGGSWLQDRLQARIRSPAHRAPGRSMHTGYPVSSKNNPFAGRVRPVQRKRLAFVQ